MGVSRFSKRIRLYLSCLFILFVFFQLFWYKLSIQRDELGDRLFGMLMGGAVADAMAGPYEGRSTEESQQFLEEGGWIDGFNQPYSRWYQSHWNVYEQGAAPGTYTDDTRLRLFLAGSMIRFGEQESFDKLYLANEIFEKYRVARTQYVDADKDVVKERFLEMWFWWELTKLASSVDISTPALLSPPAMREDLVDESGERTGYWKINKEDPFELKSNLKLDWHDGSYAEGKEWPMGQIALLPLAAYYSRNPVEAFQGVLDVNFLDVGNAPLYPAFLSVLIANGLSGKHWEAVRSELKANGVGGLVEYKGGLPIEILEPQITQALELSESFRQRADYPSRENYTAFVISLHEAFARGTDYEMCSCEEMLSVPLAIADYSMELGLAAAIEYGVNYGRDNDTVASFVASIVGAYRGRDDLPREWIELVQNTNPGVDIAELTEKLSHLSSSIH